MGKNKVEDPVTDKERTGVAKTCVSKLKLPMTALVDRIDDKVGAAYSGHPDRLFLVGKDGKISFAGARGPRGFKPDELEDAIRAELGLKPIKRKKSRDDRDARRGDRRR
jgi:hypothetical protein